MGAGPGDAGGGAIEKDRGQGWWEHEGLGQGQAAEVGKARRLMDREAGQGLGTQEQALAKEYPLPGGLPFTLLRSQSSH